MYGYFKDYIATIKHVVEFTQADILTIKTNKKHPLIKFSILVAHGILISCPLIHWLLYIQKKYFLILSGSS